MVLSLLGHGAHSHLMIILVPILLIIIGFFIVLLVDWMGGDIEPK